MNESDEPNDYLWDGSGSPDPEIQRLEQLMRPLRHDAPLKLVPPKRRRPRWIVGGAVAVAAAAAIAIVWLARPDKPCSGGEGMVFTGTGELSCGDGRVASGVLPIGSTIDTGTHEADLQIATIGVAHLGPDTRVRLDATSRAGHNLFLERGSMHARVTAPPRLFAITTPSTAVTDLGCEYEIHVDARGAGEIRVLSGKVELAADAHGVIVVAPAGTHATIRPGRHPSIPIANGASDALAAAVAAYDRGEATAIAAVIAAATESDAITIANLAVLEPANLAVQRRLGEIAPNRAWSAAAVAPVATDALGAWREDVVAAQIAIDALIDH